MDTLREILKDVNEDIRNIIPHQGNNYLRKFMECSYLKNFKLPLPEGDAPYEPTKIESDVQTKGIMWQFLKKLDTLRRQDLHQLKREVMFIDVLESVTPEEAEILCHMKEQTLDKIYPGITLEALKSVNYFPPDAQ